jgi:hypothetical protein
MLEQIHVFLKRCVLRDCVLTRENPAHLFPWVNATSQALESSLEIQGPWVGYTSKNPNAGVWLVLDFCAGSVWQIYCLYALNATRMGLQ